MTEIVVTGAGGRRDRNACPARSRPPFAQDPDRFGSGSERRIAGVLEQHEEQRSTVGPLDAAKIIEHFAGERGRIEQRPGLPRAGAESHHRAHRLHVQEVTLAARRRKPACARLSECRSSA